MSRRSINGELLSKNGVKSKKEDKDLGCERERERERERESIGQQIKTEFLLLIWRD